MSRKEISKKEQYGLCALYAVGRTFPFAVVLAYASWLNHNPIYSVPRQSREHIQSIAEFTGETPREVYTRFDVNKDGQLSEKEQEALIPELLEHNRNYIPSLEGVVQNPKPTERKSS